VLGELSSLSEEAVEEDEKDSGGVKNPFLSSMEKIINLIIK
jgi:hypothetical protein